MISPTTQVRGLVQAIAHLLVAWTATISYNGAMKTTQQCRICGKDFTRIWTRYRKPPIHCSRSCANKAPGRMTAAIRAKIGMPGARNPNYKGGWLGTDGHYRIGRRMRSHIVWDNTHPDDPVQKGEVIHHVNGDPTDDDPENLAKLPSQSTHAQHHGLSWPRGRPLSLAHRQKISATKRHQIPRS